MGIPVTGILIPVTVRRHWLAPDGGCRPSARVPARRSQCSRPSPRMCPRTAPPPHDQCPAAGQADEKGASRPVGRVLCTRLRGAAVIHLGLPLPAASCGLPASIGRAALERSRRPVPCGTGPFDLAPGGVYRAAAVACGAGGLLHHRFTLTPPCGAVCFLWHYPAGHPGSVLPTTLPCGARTFLTGPAARRDRPAGSPSIQDTPDEPGHVPRRPRAGAAGPARTRRCWRRRRGRRPRR